MSGQPRPGSRQPGPADYDAAEAAGLGEVAWADSPAAGGRPTGGTPPPTSGPRGGADGLAPDDRSPADQGPPGDSDGSAAAGSDDLALSVEDLVKDLERVTAERDQYLDASRRLQADFENYRKAVAKREHEAKERANESLVSEILPVLDACDGAVASGAADVEPVRSTLMDALVRQGLDRIDDADAPFDPERHDAVMHEPAEDATGPVVAQVLRAGYSWKGRVVRPAMVRVRG